MSSPYTPRAEDFTALHSQEEKHAISRPSLSYWQDAWIRLKNNRRALYSLYLVILMVLFTVVGPILWPYDPSLQDLDAISQGPTLGKEVLVVDNPSTWTGVTVEEVQFSALAPSASLGAPNTLQVVDNPTTQYVRLQWSPVAGAESYLIYRNDHPPESDEDLGLPLGENLSGTLVSFEDRLQLQPMDYYYTIIATDGFTESRERKTISVSVAAAITYQQALNRGLSADIGDIISLRGHPFGTDYLGRDMLARTMHGARVSLFIGLVAPFIFVLAGTIYGGISGYFGGHIDMIMMRIVDFVIALPFLLFMILFKIAFGIGPGESGIFPMLLALILLRWPDTARIVRGQVLQIREEAYVQAAKLLGGNTMYLVSRHMIPNTLGAVLVTLTFAVPVAIFTEAFLSFIGMGVAPPTPSWGSMCNEGIKTMLSSPHELFFPAFFISITVLAFNLLGDGLRDALDSRLRSTE